MDLSIIIVNYKSAQHVINCLKSIYEASMTISFEIVVVDNFSGDDSEEKICSAFPQVIWIQSEYNAGFARGNNMGIDVAKGRNVLLLNADTIVQDNALEKTVKLFDNQPSRAACGVQLLNPDGSNQHSGAKFVIGGLNLLLPLPYLGSLVRKIAFGAGVKQPNVFEVEQDTMVDWAIGAFLMTKKSTIEKYGKLDEDFFMYAEEIEWCSRLRKHGPLILYKEPKVIHLGGGSSTDYYKTKDNDNSWNLWNKKSKQIILSQLLRVRKQWGWGWYMINLTAYIVEIPLFLIFLLMDKIINGNKAKYEWTQFLGFTKNMLAIIPFIMPVLLNKKQLYKIN